MNFAVIRYIAVGSLLFAVDFSITKLLFEVAGQPIEIAQWSGRLTGAFLGYWLHRLFTFTDAKAHAPAPTQQQRLSARRSHLRYWGVAVLLWLISPLVLKTALIWTQYHLLAAKILTEATLVGFSYTLLRYVVFKKVKPVPSPAISVVIASYNHAAFVQACLQSVLTQQGVDLEIIITDDGSSDDTVQQISALNDPRIHLNVFAQNRGACVALNDAICRSRGRYIAVLNSDDLFLPGKLRQQLTYLEQHSQVGAVFGWPTFINEQGQVFSDPGHKDHAVFHTANRPRHQWLRHFFDHGNALCHPTALIRREVYNTVGLYDPRLAQVPDLDQWIRLCMAFDIHVLPEPLTAFRIRDNQQNASAARPEVVIRDAWERAYVLRHYLRLPAAQLAQVFPEFVSQSGTPAEQLARYALGQPYPFFQRFALDTWFNALPGGGTLSQPAAWPDPGAWRGYIAATGAHDLHRIYP